MLTVPYKLWENTYKVCFICKNAFHKLSIYLLLLLLLILVPVEEAKLNNHSTINHDNAHVRTWHWWLVHRHNFFR